VPIDRHVQPVSALRVLLCLWLALGTAGLPRTIMAQGGVSERDLKATYVFLFTKFVEWPESSFADSRAPFVIAVLGRDQLGGALNEVVKGETFRNRAFVVRRYNRLEDVEACQILFVSASEQANYPRIITAFHGRPTLTVADTPDFADQGGVMGLVTTRDNRLLIRVNIRAAREAGLTISSNMLSSTLVEAVLP
jgi:hypothetical protein